MHCVCESVYAIFLPMYPLCLSVPISDAELRISTVFVDGSKMINPRPDGPLDFPPPDGGGGGCLTPRLSRLLRHRRTKQKTAFESSVKIVLKLLRSLLRSGQN